MTQNPVKTSQNPDELYNYQKLNDLRKQQGLSVEQLAVKVGISAKTMYKVLRGECPMLPTIRKTIETLGGSADVLDFHRAVREDGAVKDRSASRTGAGRSNKRVA
jgi:transcriptional regulator with XRE-family HTH domain